MKFVYGRSGGVRFGLAHASEFRIRKPIGLQICKAPVRIAVAWTRGDCGVVGADGFFGSAQGFQGMCNG